MKFEVVKNNKSITKCLDAVVKYDCKDGSDFLLSYDEVNEYVKSKNLFEDLVDGTFVIKRIGIKIVTLWNDGHESKIKKEFTVYHNSIGVRTNYKKKYVVSICHDRNEKYFEQACSEVKKISCYIFIDDFNKGISQDYLVRSVTPDEFKVSNRGGKQKATREIEQNWSESVDKLVAYRGLPSDNYISSYLNSCKLSTGNRDKSAKSSKINELLQIPLKQSSEKQQTYLLKLLDGRCTNLDVSLLNTYQSGALIDNLTYEPVSGADCVQNEEQFLELYTFFLKRQWEGIKNF